MIPWMALVLLCMISLQNKKQLWLLRGAGILLFLFMLINSSFYLDARRKDFDTFEQIQKDLAELETQKDIQLQLSNPEFFAYYYNLDDEHISYQIVKKEIKENFVYKYHWQFKVLLEA